VTVALIDDQLLSRVLRGKSPRYLASRDLYTTGYWHVRLCLAVLGAQERTGQLSRPFAELPAALRDRAIRTLLELPRDVGLISLRELAPLIGQLRHHHLNILGMEALAAATTLRAEVHISAPSPLLQHALEQEGITVKVHRN